MLLNNHGKTHTKKNCVWHWIKHFYKKNEKTLNSLIMKKADLIYE